MLQASTRACKDRLAMKKHKTSDDLYPYGQNFEIYHDTVDVLRDEARRIWGVKYYQQPLADPENDENIPYKVLIPVEVNSHCYKVLNATVGYNKEVLLDQEYVIFKPDPLKHEWQLVDDPSTLGPQTFGVKPIMLYQTPFQKTTHGSLIYLDNETYTQALDLRVGFSKNKAINPFNDQDTTDTPCGLPEFSMRLKRNLVYQLQPQYESDRLEYYYVITKHTTGNDGGVICERCAVVTEAGAKSPADDSSLWAIFIDTNLISEKLALMLYFAKINFKSLTGLSWSLFREIRMPKLYTEVVVANAASANDNARILQKENENESTGDSTQEEIAPEQPGWRSWARGVFMSHVDSSVRKLPDRLVRQLDPQSVEQFPRPPLGAPGYDPVCTVISRSLKVRNIHVAFLRTFDIPAPQLANMERTMKSTLSTILDRWLEQRNHNNGNHTHRRLNRVIPPPPALPPRAEPNNHNNGSVLLR